MVFRKDKQRCIVIEFWTTKNTCGGSMAIHKIERYAQELKNLDILFNLSDKSSKKLHIWTMIILSNQI